jgi:ketosteroid isomerase-like protein
VAAVPPPKTVIRRAYEAFAARDVETLRALSTPDLEIKALTGVLADRPEPYRGAEGIAQYIADVSEVWDELELEPVDFHPLQSGEFLVYGRVRARRGSMRLDSANAWLWRLEGELVRSVEVFGDLVEASELLREKGPEAP